MKNLIVLFMIASMAGIVIADANWTNGNGTRLWDEPGNWRDGILPVATAKTNIWADTDGPLITTGTAAESLQIDLGRTLDIEGGTLTANGWFIIGYGGTSVGTFNVSGGVTTISSADHLTVGLKDSSTGYLNIRGGSVVIEPTRELYIARESADSTGYLNMTGGTLSVGDDFIISKGTGYINVSGGEVNVADRLYTGDNASAKAYLNMTGGSITLGGLMSHGRNGALAHMQLDGGVLDIGLQLEIGSNATIDITRGKLIVGGDRVTAGTAWNIQDKIDNGQITAYGGFGTVAAVYDAVDDVTIVTGIQAAVPIHPENGGSVLTGDVNLQWENIDPNNATGEVFVDVWFGDDPEGISGGTWQQIVTASPNDPNRTSFQSVTAAVPGTYYWRVDSYVQGADKINAENKIEGALFSFEAVLDKAPTSVTIDTNNTIAWSGLEVPLASTIVDEGPSDVTCVWTADPNEGVVFTPNDGGDGFTYTYTGPLGDYNDPTVTVTKAPQSPELAVTLTLAVSDGTLVDGNPVPPIQDTVQITVFDDACQAAREGDGRAAATDLTGDCITNLADFALLAKAWLIDYTELAPFAK